MQIFDEYITRTSYGVISRADNTSLWYFDTTLFDKTDSRVTLLFDFVLVPIRVLWIRTFGVHGYPSPLYIAFTTDTESHAIICDVCRSPGLRMFQILWQERPILTYDKPCVINNGCEYIETSPRYSLTVSGNWLEYGGHPT